MAWHPEARRMRLDGTDVVVLSPEAYKRLDGIRRQAGAQSSRMHALRQQLAAATATLEEIRQAAVGADCAAGPASPGSGCAGRELLAILARDAPAPGLPR